MRNAIRQFGAGASPLLSRVDLHSFDSVSVAEKASQRLREQMKLPVEHTGMSFSLLDGTLNALNPGACTRLVVVGDLLQVLTWMTP